MSYLVEQSPYCDLLKLSLMTRGFVLFRRTRPRLSIQGWVSPFFLHFSHPGIRWRKSMSFQKTLFFSNFSHPGIRWRKSRCLSKRLCFFPTFSTRGYVIKIIILILIIIILIIILIIAIIIFIVALRSGAALYGSNTRTAGRCAPPRSSYLIASRSL